MARLDGSMRPRLKAAIEKIVRQPQSGKPLKHFSNVFSECVGPFRLIYKLEPDVLLLVCFKNRDEVYDELAALI